MGIAGGLWRVGSRVNTLDMTEEFHARLGDV
jgi:hypothetical protein